jgi:predicted transcriptional regulator
MLSLWRGGPLTVSEISTDLARRGHTLSYTTILTLLQRLQAKGLVKTARVSAATTAYLYSPTIDFETAARRAIHRFLRDYQFDSEGLEILRSVVEEALAKPSAAEQLLAAPLPEHR